jgi:hypothetical protein
MKIIYLDQFVLQKAFCPTSGDTHKDFFVQLGELCVKLAEKGVAAFPFSECHLRETALLRHHPKKGAMASAIAERFGAISNGYQFCPAQGIQQLQASAVRKGFAIDWSPQRAIFRNTKLGFREQLRGTTADDRNLHHAALMPVLLQYVGATEVKLDGIARREAQTYGELLTKDLAQMMTGTTPDLLSLIAKPHFRLFMELEMEMRVEGIGDSLNAAYCFVRDRAMEVPCIRLESELWEYFIKTKRQRLDKENDPASTAEDIRFTSFFVPYCDAAFLEIRMTSWLQQSKLSDGHRTELFSLKHRKAEFLQYLSGLEKQHVLPVSSKTFSAYEAERLPKLRQHARPLLWICFVPTHPDSLVRLKNVSLQGAPNSLLECRILPGGGVEWIETIPAATSVSSGEVESRIRRALDRIMAIPREGCHVSMQVNYSLANCNGLQIKSLSVLRSKRIQNDLLRLGASDWYTEGPDLLWPKPDEVLAALFQSKSSRRGVKERRVSAAPTGLG